MLYHYTTAAGLLGIVNDRRIWATEFNFLNDPGEVLFGADTVIRGLTSLQSEYGSSSVGAEELRNTIEWMSSRYLDPDSSRQYHEDRSHVASFSLSDDVLTLYRNYSGKDGFCVGFDERQLLKWFGVQLPEEAPEHNEETDGIFQNYGLHASVERVEYGNQAADKLTLRMRQLLLTPGYRLATSEESVRSNLERLITIKHEAYIDERETRLVVRRVGDNSPKPLVRASPSIGLVTYHALAFPREALVSITAAPGIRQARSLSAVRSLLNDGGRDWWWHVKLKASGIPFSW